MAPGFIGTFWALKRVLGTVQCVMKGQLPGFALGSSPSSASRVLNWKNGGEGPGRCRALLMSPCRYMFRTEGGPE